jgi:hypothetical protein
VVDASRGWVPRRRRGMGMGGECGGEAKLKCNAPLPLLQARLYSGAPTAERRRRVVDKATGTVA